MKLAEQEAWGYEFEIRSELSRLWCTFLKETSDFNIEDDEQTPIDAERIKQMLLFIHEHYMNKIEVSDIAASASISPRECNRCFQRSISMAPINYLKEYRIRMAAQMLSLTDDSIITIAENCGFSSGSYFSKTFQEFMNCTPREYRKK